jgi:hypothetical protein
MARLGECYGDEPREHKREQICRIAAKLAKRLEKIQADRERAQVLQREPQGRPDTWLPACGGTEQPFTCKGRRLLYCWNPARDEHAYLDLDTDLFLSNEEAWEILGS